MTATELTRETAGDAGAVPSTPLLLALIRRTITRMVRLPAILAPTVIMPAFFITAFTGSFDGISRIEGYPTDNIVNWVAAFAILQSCAFAGIGAAAAMATDLDTRFIDRMLVSPMRRGLVILAPLGQAAVRALIPITIILLICIPKGASMPAGVAGVAMVYLGGISMAIVMGLLGLGVVLLIGNIRAMAVVQVISFLVLFPSTGQVPIELMDGWLATMARWNPATPMLAMTRQGFLGDLTWADTSPGLAVTAAGLVLFGAFARAQLRRLDG